MHDHEVELSVGDVLRIGSCTVKVIDIDGENVSLRVDDTRSTELASDLEDYSKLPR